MAETGNGIVEAVKAVDRNTLGNVRRMLVAGYDFKAIRTELAIGETQVESLAQDAVRELVKIETALRADSKLLHDENDRLRTDVQGLENLQGAIRESCVAIVPTTMQYEPAGTKKTRSSAVLVLSDWHIGTIVTKKQVEGLNTYNFRIASERVKFLGERVLHNIETMRAGFQIDDLYVLLLGDMISGGIHKELDMFNEFSPPQQAVKAGGLVADLVAFLAPHFAHVKIHAQEADNHGRLFPKPMAKGKGAYNYNVVVNSVAQNLLSKHSNVLFHVFPGMKGVVKIEQMKFLCQHGDVIKGWQGIPRYGIEREKNREKVKRLVFRRLAEETSGIDFDALVIGHFHQFGWEEEIIMNGSLSGTDEYDHSCGRFGMPHQVSFLVHPKHGVHSFNRWILNNGTKQRHRSDSESTPTNS